MIPQLMQAAKYENYGPPENLSVCDVTTPECTSNSVLVKVHYSTVNRTDCGFLRAKPFIVRFFAGLSKPRSTILGCEFSGEVVEIGSEVTDFSVGDAVFGFKDDDFGFGGHAQYTAIPQHGLIEKIPPNFNYETAAAGLEGSHYALFGVRAANIEPSHRVLVNGGTGAIGSAAVQLIHALGAEVTAVCSTEHLDTVRELGAKTVIDYRKTDFTQLDEQFDFVYDAVGKSTFGQCKRILAPNGLYLSTELGPFCQNPFLALGTKWFSKWFDHKRVLFPIPSNDRKDAQYISELMKNNQFAPLIDRTYPLSDIVSAFHYVESGEKIGNVLIKIKHEDD